LWRENNIETNAGQTLPQKFIIMPLVLLKLRSYLSQIESQIMYRKLHATYKKLMSWRSS